MELCDLIEMLRPLHFPRENAQLVGNAIDNLRARPRELFREYFMNFSGARVGGQTGYEILDFIGKKPNICSSTEDVRYVINLPSRYLVISEMIADSILVYDCASDGVHVADFEGTFEMIVDRKIAPDWNTFEEFLRCHFDLR